MCVLVANWCCYTYRRCRIPSSPPLQTPEGYFQFEVRSILNNVVTALTADASKTFVWEESFFLQRWWRDANTTDAQRAQWKALLESGRLELIGGGWTMHDEESTSAFSAVSNMEYGLSWLTETFGEVGTR